MDAFARRAPSSQEGASQENTKGRRGRRSSGRVLNGEKGFGKSGRRTVTSRGHEIPFHALKSHRKSRAFRAEFDIMHKFLAVHARNSTVVFVVRTSLRPAAHECILFCVALRSGTIRHDIICMYFRCTFCFKTACLSPGTVHVTKRNFIRIGS